MPRHFVDLGVRVAAPGGWTLGIDHVISSSVWADDANAIRVGDWGAGVTDVRLAWNGGMGRSVLLPFAGINNVFDRSYVGSVTVNGFNGRVFEPAPGRNVYVGLETRFAKER